ncbi:vacuolar amino acid transporter 4 [Lentinula raphanica]|nr:vacuolar amino acid transporter 4 [Lentinula raphanica]
MSTPSKPLGIPRRDSQSRSATPVGTPDLRILRAQVASGTPPVGLSIPPPNIPLRTSSPAPSAPYVEGTPASQSAARIQQAELSRTDSPLNLPVDLDDLPDEEKAKILRRHLVSKEERERERREAQEVTPSSTPDVVSHTRRSSGSGRIAREDSEPFPVPYAAPGADVTHDIYKWNLNAQRQARRVRSASFSAVPRPAPDPAFEHIHQPGGFRRNYVLMHSSNEVGNEEPRVFVNNFIDFLFLFGHFAGEDLEEEEEDKDEDDLEGLYPEPSTSNAPTLGFGDLPAIESSPLLGGKPRMSRSRSRSRRRTASMSTGNATVGQAVLMLLKGFVGTGVLFLGKAFMNGGILFSSLLFIFIAVISLHSFLLLVRAKLVVPGSFGDIGGALYGPWMRHLILSSIVLSQIGFVGAYMIFVSENLQAFVSSVTNCVQYVPVKYFILIQAIIFLPLSLIRDIVKLSTTALVADAFILVGLLYIFGSEIGLVIDRGTRDVQLFNTKDFSLFVGTAVFSFEGIGLIVPIADSMREPHKFPRVLTGVMAFLLVLFGGAGVLAYLTFGSDIQTVVLVNLNEVHPGSRMLQVVQFFYSLAILLSVPLQLFPAIRIMENGLFTRSGKADTRVKWMKNFFRFATVIVTAGVSLAGAKDLDKFVAFVGCFACVPLCYVYPAMLHYRACAHTRKKKIADIAMIVFGLIAAAFTTVQTIKLMIEPEVGGPPVGECDPPRV